MRLAAAQCGPGVPDRPRRRRGRLQAVLPEGTAKSVILLGVRAVPAASFDESTRSTVIGTGRPGLLVPRRVHRVAASASSGMKPTAPDLAVFTSMLVNTCMADPARTAHHTGEPPRSDTRQARIRTRTRSPVPPGPRRADREGRHRPGGGPVCRALIDLFAQRMERGHRRAPRPAPRRASTSDDSSTA